MNPTTVKPDANQASGFTVAFSPWSATAAPTVARVQISNGWACMWDFENEFLYLPCCGADPIIHRWLAQCSSCKATLRQAYLRDMGQIARLLPIDLNVLESDILASGLQQHLLDLNHRRFRTTGALRLLLAQFFGGEDPL